MSDLFLGYHASKIKFESFEESMIGSRKGSHANSNLGFWFFCSPEHTSHFGGHVLEAGIDLGKIYNMPLSELSSLSQDNNEDPDFFQSMRKDLIERGFSSISIIESSGELSMYVVLQEKSIKNLRIYTEDSEIKPSF